MQVTLTFDLGDDKDQIIAMVERAFGGEAAAPAKPATETAAAKKKRLAAEKAAAEETTEAETVEEAPASEHSRDDVRAKLKEYAALEGKEAAIQILKDNGAASIGELDEAKFASVMEACGD